MLIYLPTEEVIMEVHEAILEVSGGRPGILNGNAIKSAVNRPKTYLSYHEDCDIHTVCAVLIDSIARNHAFVEGNKRTGLMTALLTYDLNGIQFSTKADETDEFENLVLWIVLEKPEVPAIALRLHELTNRYKIKSPSKVIEQLKKFLTPFNTDN